MISAVLLSLASLSVPAASAAAIAPDTVRSMKGHPALPARAAAAKGGASAACHPDPYKGRACRHHVTKAQEARGDAVLRAEAGSVDVAIAD